MDVNKERRLLRMSPSVYAILYIYIYISVLFRKKNISSRREGMPTQKTRREERERE